MLKGAFWLLLVSVVLALVVNAISPNGLSLVGEYRSLSSGEGPLVPPDAEPGDPPFVDINQAYLEHSSGTAVFVDARDPEEFECGTIPGSVSIPFDYLPETDLEGYLDSALAGVSQGDAIVTFCSGEECDLSLHLARNMRDVGYTHVLIFFGGAREWEKYGLPMERRVDCDN